MMERKCALETLNEIMGQNAYSNLALNQILKKYENADGSFVRQLVYGVLENRIYLDYMLQHFLSIPLNRTKLTGQNLLRLGAYQLLFLDFVPDYAAINESVNLAKKAAGVQPAFINGVLRNLQRRKEEVPFPEKEKDFIDWLCIKASYEPWMIHYWKEHYGAEFTEKLAFSENETAPLTIRVNSLKMERDDLMEALKRDGFSVRKGIHSESAVFVEGKDLLSHELFKKGCFQVQDESSMMAVEALDPRPGDLVLDLCAAPGGKTLYAGERMENRREILAIDLYEHKLKLLSAAAKRHGIENIQVKAWDATRLFKEMEGKGDKVLCDAPCSGLGVIRRKPEIKYTKSLKGLEALVQTQKKLLQRAAQYVKPGGTLVYSTCTISPMENEGVTEWFLKENENFVCRDQRLFTPFREGTDGFFFCKFEKRKGM